MKNSFIVCTAITLICSCFQINSNKKQYHFILPEGYSGIVFVEFGISKTPALEIKDTNLIINVPSSGIIETSTLYKDFAGFSSKTRVTWKNSKENHKYEIRNFNYGYFSTSINDRVDTININGETRFSRKTTADDFNYLCFYVNENPQLIKWDSLIYQIRLDSMDCKSIIARKNTSH